MTILIHIMSVYHVLSLFPPYAFILCSMYVTLQAVAALLSPRQMPAHLLYMANT